MRAQASILALLLLALAAPGAVAAGTGGDLLRKCLKPTHVEDSEAFARTGKATGMCRGYLRRIFSLLAAGAGAGERIAARHRICLPPAMPGDDELVSRFVDYAERNPDRLGERQLQVVLAAYHELWPCPEEARPASAKPAPEHPAPARATAPGAPPEPRPGAGTPPAPEWTVSEVQARLKALGYDPGPRDGVNGPLTAAAIRAFQRDHGLAPDGRLSDALFEAMRQAAAAAP